MTTTPTPGPASANGELSSPPAQVADLPQGPIRYREWGSGEPLVFVHGLLVDGRLWEATARRLGAAGHRCIVPDWPFGSHELPLSSAADLSPPGVAEIILAFLDSLGLETATVVGNDSGGAMSQILTARHPERVNRLVLTNCDTFEHFPPAPFNLMPPIAKLPGGMFALGLPFRIGAVRRATFGQFTKRPVDPALIDAWMEPSQRDPRVMRDLRKYTVGIHKRYTLEAAERLRDFERPVRFAWAPEDRFFKLAHAERLAAMLRDASIVEIEDAKTFVALDQPERLAQVIDGFVREGAPAAA